MIFAMEIFLICKFNPFTGKYQEKLGGLNYDSTEALNGDKYTSSQLAVALVHDQTAMEWKWIMLYVKISKA